MRRRGNRNNKSKKTLFIWSTTLLFLTMMLLFNDLGLVRMFELRLKRNVIKAEIEQIKLEISEKEEEKNRLENDPEYIEKIARENYRMVKPGEKVYRVRDERRVK